MGELLLEAVCAGGEAGRRRGLMRFDPRADCYGLETVNRKDFGVEHGTEIRASIILCRWDEREEPCPTPLIQSWIECWSATWPLVPTAASKRFSSRTGLDKRF